MPTSVEVEYKRAKDGAQEASALNKKIQELASKIDDIVKRAATYAEDLKAFVDNIEIDLFLPKLASNLAQEINNILHIKEQLQKENTGAYPLETLKDVTNKIITYLKDLSLCSESVDEEQVVSHIVAIQNSTNKEDPFGYLDEAENELALISSLHLTASARNWRFNFRRWITYVLKNRPWNKRKLVVTNI